MPLTRELSVRADQVRGRRRSLAHRGLLTVRSAFLLWAPSFGLLDGRASDIQALLEQTVVARVGDQFGSISEPRLLLDVGPMGLDRANA